MKKPSLIHRLLLFGLYPTLIVALICTPFQLQGIMPLPIFMWVTGLTFAGCVVLFFWAGRHHYEAWLIKVTYYHGGNIDEECRRIRRRYGVSAISDINSLEKNMQFILMVKPGTPREEVGPSKDWYCQAWKMDRTRI